jgi:hypothetical protein
VIHFSDPEAATLPICEGARFRQGGSVAAISHRMFGGVLVTNDLSGVTCDECLAWVHA